MVKGGVDQLFPIVNVSKRLMACLVEVGLKVGKRFLLKGPKGR